MIKNIRKFFLKQKRFCSVLGKHFIDITMLSTFEIICCSFLLCGLIGLLLIGSLTSFFNHISTRKQTLHSHYFRLIISNLISLFIITNFAQKSFSSYLDIGRRFFFDLTRIDLNLSIITIQLVLRIFLSFNHFFTINFSTV